MKKLLATLLASATALTALGGLVACGGDNGGDSKNKITIWCPSAAIPAYESLVDGFKAANPDYAKYTYNFAVMAEHSSLDELSKDPANGADIFFFQTGNIQALLKGNFLQTLDIGGSTTHTDAIKARDLENTVAPILNEDGIAMAYPATNDNGWFTWYDSKVFSEDDVKSLDKMVDVARKNGKKIMMNTSAWYTSSFFFAVGCKANYDSKLTPGSYTIDFDSAAGIAAAKAVQKYWSSGVFVKTDDGHNNDDCAQGLADGTLAACFNGTWIASTIETECGKTKKKFSEIKAVKNPSITVDLGNGPEQKQLVSFSGVKYCGVNAAKTDPDKMAASIAFADWMTNQAGQEKRFEITKAGPSNKVVAASDEVKKDMALSALADQISNYGYPELKHIGEFWSQISSFVDGCLTGGADGVTEANVEAKIKECVKNIREADKA